jgi:hypothetical protein
MALRISFNRGFIPFGDLSMYSSTPPGSITFDLLFASRLILYLLARSATDNQFAARFRNSLHRDSVSAASIAINSDSAMNSIADPSVSSYGQPQVPWGVHGARG